MAALDSDSLHSKCRKGEEGTTLPPAVNYDGHLAQSYTDTWERNVGRSPI